ncbi:DUF3857 domain-containing protein [Flavihumibacter petaseus]|uniref:DUF3857 domain-containing protein n=1 Tax=Flavihumibacter petaseus NBRC 106054 TaxID=1220578 RepID=A0A0E9N1J5_9BACT|nr:DUF3857 domain-containing protein [Flavihumibacter petaseus]GAO43648.1 hypothetical protein FPE01S_02_07540 [Flavihumibacter petaseus NBRC 106054]
MKNILLILAVFIGSVSSVLAGGGEPNYSIVNIPKELLKNASAVIRLEEEAVVVSSYNRYKHSMKRVVTILNEAADDEAAVWLSYSKSGSVDHLEGALYDALGNKIRSLKKSEIEDRASSGGGVMYSDSRYKHHNFHYKVYPYTVEYEYEQTSDVTMILPHWNPYTNKGISIERNKYSITVDKDIVLYRKQLNWKQEPQRTENSKQVTYTWQLNNQPAFIKEYYSPAIEEIAPVAFFTLGKFNFGSFDGSFSSWESFGVFMSTMWEGLDVLPEEIKKQVHLITDGLPSDEAKSRALYSFLQKNTHYVFVKLGIGGWRPHPASYVVSNGYGDCKALTNYMVALLKEAGVKAYPALVVGNYDERKQLLDFPNPYFNHVICAVPLKGDTLWLECTSQTDPAGYNGYFTGNKHALLFAAGGGKLVTTTFYDKQVNQQYRNIDAVVGAEGGLELTSVTRYTGQTAGRPQYVMTNKSKEDQLKYLKENLDLPSYDVVDYSYVDEQQKNLSIREQLRLKLVHYAQLTGKRLFVTPNIMNKWDQKLIADTARKYGLELDDDITETDTVKITVPSGYQLEATVKPTVVSTPFGAYKAEATMAGNVITYTRRLTLNRGRFEAKQYNELAAFYEQLYKYDRARVVLVKSD